MTGGETAGMAGDRPASRRVFRFRTAAVLLVALAAAVPTVGDIGLTWDEPAYRFSQLRSEAWWSRLAHARDAKEVGSLLAPDALLFYWTYARHGINFHPPLAGQASVLTRAIFGGVMKDIPARRMASVLEFCLAVTLAYGFLGRRYGGWVGLIAAGALLTMPRIYGDGHVAGTDTPGLLLWPATALAFWKGLYEPDARRWRVLVGVLLGLAFVEKMAAIFVMAPLLVWLVVARLPKTFGRGGRADWVDGVLTSGSMLGLLALAFAEILRLARELPQPNVTDLFLDRPASYFPGAILAAPMGVWLVRRWLARLFPRDAVWGVERPALEVWTAVLAFAPVVGWLGNPAWWRETLPRFAHYYLINTQRRGALPDIRILYLGRIYEYALPWHNGWVLIGVTVPAAVLFASLIGIGYTFRVAGRDKLPLYFLLHLVTLPIFRMFPTPAHDGVRLFLPTFFFLAAAAGWGAVWAADGLARRLRTNPNGVRAAFAALVVGTSAWQLARVHPYELSYYNELIGGPRGAWRAGFELTYWYDPFNPPTLAEINGRLPRNAEVDFHNDRTLPMTFLDLQSVGALRPDVLVGWRDSRQFSFAWLLSQDSKASALTRLMFAMQPWYASTPRQVGDSRIASVIGPVVVSRATALSLLTQMPEPPPDQPLAPGWVRETLPFLARFWGEGLSVRPPDRVNEAIFVWAQTNPEGLRAAARSLAASHTTADDPAAARLYAIGARNETMFKIVLRDRPEALIEAVDILIRKPDAVRTVLTSSMYTDPATVGGYLDAGLPEDAATAASVSVIPLDDANRR